METNIPGDDLNTLFEKVGFLLSKDDYACALSLLSQAIDKTFSKNINLPYLLNSRASILSRIHVWDPAIADIKRCISISPDDCQYYLTMGVFLTWKHFYTDKFRIDDSNEVLKDSIYFYKESLKRDPTNTTAWLNTIETYLFLRDWENALSHLGMCKPYLYSQENKLIWTWLICLSLALAGDPLESCDRELLVDCSLHYTTNHDYQQIDCVIAELERIQFYPERLKLANEIHHLYKKRIGAK